VSHVTLRIATTLHRLERIGVSAEDVDVGGLQKWLTGIAISSEWLTTRQSHVSTAQSDITVWRWSGQSGKSAVDRVITPPVNILPHVRRH